MNYRKMGKLNIEVSALGFGTMRLPTLSNSADIDQVKAIEMIRYAIDHGVNYFDTAWSYHGGESEPLLGKALQDGYRERVNLATKMPSWKVRKRSDLDYYFNKQLERLKTDKIDFYLLHTLEKGYWETYKKIDVFSWIEKVLQEGKITYIGFSFHDDYSVFKEIIDSYNWDFCQIQYNYLDTEFQAGRKGLKYAAERNIPVVIMEPLRGGKLAEDPPSVRTDLQRTPADLALQWLWNQHEVSVVLSGMSTLNQVKENIGSACDSGVNSLNNQELKTIERIKRAYQGPVGCTGCNYCMPCPNGVNIPQNFVLYNNAHISKAFTENQNKYLKMKEEERASACVQCGACESVCPQHLSIMSLLKDVADYFA